MFSKADLIKKLKTAQNVLDGSQNPESPYVCGQWNGLEYALSICENREPKYRLEEGDKPPVKRTISNGKLK